MLSQVLQSVERKSLASVLRVGIKYTCGWAVLECVRICTEKSTVR